MYRANIGQIAPAINIIGRPGPTGNLEVHASGGNVLGRWRRQLGDRSDLQVRAGGVPIAAGEVVIVDENLGLRLSRIVPPGTSDPS